MLKTAGEAVKRYFWIYRIILCCVEGGNPHRFDAVPRLLVLDLELRLVAVLAVGWLEWIVLILDLAQDLPERLRPVLIKEAQEVRSAL